MTIVYRIGTDVKEYTACDLSGEGAKRTGGRWNPRGTPLVYAASSRALACLETVVHINSGRLPLNRYLVEIDVPRSLYGAAVIFDPAANIGWDACPAGNVSIDAGSKWATSGASAIMVVPSVIVPEEQNILINPLHPDSSQIKARKIRKWFYDSRLGGQA